MASSPAPAAALVVASTFYTPALEKPLADALARRSDSRQLICVPYNQLQAFLLNSSAIIPSGLPVQVLVLLRVEDLIRPELSKANAASLDEISRAFRERASQLELLLARTQLRLTVLLCPAGRGYHDVRFLGNQVRIAEHKIASALRLRRRHLVVEWFDWQDFAVGVQSGKWLNLAGDRLGHVPFTPEALDRIASYFVERLEMMPVTSPAAQTGAADSAALAKFLGSLDLELTAASLASADEQSIVDLVRHTTHFVNLVEQRWDRAALRELIGPGEAWIFRTHDRFGDYGISGAITFHIRARVMEIGLLFLTCPVLGKQVEHALFAWLGQVANERGAESIDIPFTRGRDNEGLCSMMSALGEEPVHLPISAEKVFRLRVSGLSERAISMAVNPTAVTEILSVMSAGSAV